MSGGSYDYLYSKEIEDVGFLKNVEKMAIDMEREGFVDIAQHLRFILKCAELITDKKNSLVEVLKSWEWYQSGDWGIEPFIVAENKYLQTYNDPKHAAFTKLVKESKELIAALEKKKGEMQLLLYKLEESK